MTEPGTTENVKMQVPFVDLAAQFAEIESEVRSAIDRVFEYCAFAGGPAVVEEFELRFAQYCGAAHCVAVGSGSAALEVLLRAYGVGPGDEVILPVNTFVAAAEAISLLGARAVFVDVHADTANLHPELLTAAVSSRTKGIIAVHLYGQPADMEPILSLASRHGLFVIEDSSQAHGALCNGRRVGSLADAAAFSFYPSKNLGAYGEAGCITTNDPGTAKRVRMLRDHGASSKHHYDLIGRNDRMDGIQGAVLSVKLQYLDRWNQQRRARAEQYRSALCVHPHIRLFSEMAGCAPVYHLFVVRVPERDRVRQALREKGIMTGIHYPIPLHLQPAYKRLGYTKGAFPVSETLASEVLSLPMYAELKPQQVAYVADELMNIV